MVDCMPGSTLPNLNSSWQSVTWFQNGGQPQATITISMGRKFIFQDTMTITFASEMPQQMILQKSTDFGLTWTALQYYNMSCTQLWNNGVKSAVGVATPDDVICTQSYSSPYPNTGGEVKFDVNRDRFGLFLGPTLTNFPPLFDAFNNTNLLPFLSFTDLRIQLVYPATDGNEASGKMDDLVKYYYAISDIDLIAG